MEDIADKFEYNKLILADHSNPWLVLFKFFKTKCLSPAFFIISETIESASLRVSKLFNDIEKIASKTLLKRVDS